MTKKSAKVLRKLNNLNEEKMSKESDLIYSDMVIYLRFSELTLLQQEIVRSDLIQMIIDGEERGENIHEILGKDYKLVCDEIISSFPPMSKKDKILNAISLVSMSFSIILGIYVFSQFVTGLIEGGDFLTFNFTMSYLFIFPLNGLFAYFVIKYISNIDFKEKSKPLSKKKETLFAYIVLLIFVAITIVFETTFNQILFQTSFFTMVTVVILLAMTFLSINAKSEY